MKKFSFIIISCAALFFASCNSENQKDNGSHSSSTIQSPAIHEIIKGIIQIPNSQVCMVNNKFMAKDQIPVPINGKTYYGCCPGCVANLKDDTTYRFALDPQTRERVDKADAVIIAKPGTKEEVLYFKSEVNAKKFIEKRIPNKVVR